MRRMLIVLLLLGCGERRAVSPAAESAPTAEVAQAPSASPTPRTDLPSPEQARELIAASADFGEFEFTNAGWSLPMHREQMNEPALANARDLERAGWIRFNGAEVVLTAKAKTDKRFILRPSGYTDIVPLAKKEVTEVAAVHPAEDGNAKVNFCWRWVPNEVGASFTQGILGERWGAMQCATATLMASGNGRWEMLMLERQKDSTTPTEASP